MLWGADLIASVEGNFGMKINDDYANSRTPSAAIADVAPYGKDLFVDYKLMKGKTRMINMVNELGTIGGVHFTNIYVLAGKLLRATIKETKESGVSILGITILTHMDEAYCQRTFRRSLQESVLFLTEDARDYGCAGVVMPGTCLDAVKDISLIKVIPAIRPTWYVGKKANQQEQPVTPSDVFRFPNTVAVAGSPIWDTEYPADSLMRILDEINDTRAKLPR